VDDIANALCDKINQCAPFAIKLEYGDVANCKTRNSAAAKAELQVTDVSISDAEIKACAAAYSAASCGDVFDGKITGCDFKGKRADGAKCTSGAQCASGSCYRDTSGGTVPDCGSCKARVAENGDCTAASCERGLVCNTAKKCVKRAALDGDCTSTSCSYGSTCVSGKCTATLAESAACQLGAGKASCDSFKGLYCKAAGGDAGVTSGTCQQFAFANVGEKCGIDTTTFTYTQCNNSSCVTDTGGKGTCTAFVKDGDACTSKDTCAAPASCRGGKCGFDTNTCN
jgi:hypothetical protein